jgi:hypothetical protein
MDTQDRPVFSSFARATRIAAAIAIASLGGSVAHADVREAGLGSAEPKAGTVEEIRAIDPDTGEPSTLRLASRRGGGR